MHRAGGDRMNAGPVEPADTREPVPAVVVDALHHKLLDARRRLDEAIRALRVLGDAVRTVAGQPGGQHGVQSVCALAALHVDQVLLELER